MANHTSAVPFTFSLSAFASVFIIFSHTTSPIPVCSQMGADHSRRKSFAFSVRIVRFYR
jgi:hypothetical protein